VPTAVIKRGTTCLNASAVITGSKGRHSGSNDLKIDI